MAIGVEADLGFSWSPSESCSMANVLLYERSVKVFGDWGV